MQILLNQHRYFIPVPSNNKKIDDLLKNIIYDYDSQEQIYHSDNYKFEAKARKDNMYEVTVTNTDTNTAVVYEVDPNDGTFTYITDIGEE